MYKITILFISLAMCLSAFSSCVLLKKNRIINHNGIQRTDFDLPLIFYPSAKPRSHTLALMLSGDGGWMEFEDQMGLTLAGKGINTIGFNSRSYFWEQKTPDETAAAIIELLHKYAGNYRTRNIILCGYSFGADVVPFIYNRLPEHLKSKVHIIGLLSPFATSDFVVKTSDLLNIAGDNKLYKVQPEVEKIAIPIYCFYGEGEEPKPLHEVSLKNFNLKILPGDHHYQEAASKEISDSLTAHIKHIFPLRGVIY